MQTQRGSRGIYLPILEVGAKWEGGGGVVVNGTLRPLYYYYYNYYLFIYLFIWTAKGFVPGGRGTTIRHNTPERVSVSTVQKAGWAARADLDRCDEEKNVLPAPRFEP
jgi:hypothetical protein